MSTSVETLSRWFDEGVKEDAAYMIVVCDTYDYEDYPVFFKGTGIEAEVARRNSESMQRVMEVYNLSKNKEEQLSEDRCFNY